MMKLWLSLVSCMLIVFLMSCSSIPIGRNYEPASVIIRNTSKEHIKEVSIREDRNLSNSVRMGVISPLPRGASQVVGRPTNPPPFPNKIIVCWVNMIGIEICKPVNIKDVLSMTPVKGKALVFDIRNDSELRVYIENSR